MLLRNLSLFLKLHVLAVESDKLLLLPLLIGWQHLEPRAPLTAGCVDETLQFLKIGKYTTPSLSERV